MSSLHTELETPIDLRVARDAFDRLRATTLIKEKNLEVVRLVAPEGKEIPPHRAPGELLVQCLNGRVSFTAMGKTRELTPGQMIHLPAHRHHALRAMEDSVLLLTIALSPPQRDKDEVDEASSESFPASDAPSWTGTSNP